VCVSRAAMAPLDELLQGQRVAGGGDLDVTFEGIANPAGEAETIGLFLGGSPVADTLDSTLYEEMDRRQDQYFAASPAFGVASRMNFRRLSLAASRSVLRK
jgi:hypothetical protein